MSDAHPSIPSESASPRSSIADAPTLGNGRDLFWGAYVEAVEAEGRKVGDYSATNMNGVLAFTGLFAAVIAAFLIESYKRLSPDPGAQLVELVAQNLATNAQSVQLGAQTVMLLSHLVSANRTLVPDVPTQPLAELAPASVINGTLGMTAQAFRASKTDIVVNTLWLVGLIISLASALLATMVQEWMRRFLRVQGRLTHESKERYSLEHMPYHIAAEDWALDRAPSLVVGLMHTAVIFFVVGLDVFLFSIHTTPALVIAALTGTLGLCYVIVSCVPLFSATSPYATPLTDLLAAAIVAPLSTIFCLLTYFLLLVLAVHQRITDGLLPATRQVLSPAPMMHFMGNPHFTKRAIRALVDYLARRRSGANIKLLPHVLEEICDLGALGVQQTSELFLREREIEFIWDRVGAFALEHPPALQFFVHNFANARTPEFDAFFTGFRYDTGCMESIAAALLPVQSVFAATGSLRLLQMLFQAETPYDEISQAVSHDEWRWRLADPITRVFRRFAEGVGQVNEAALKTHDTSVIEAVSSLRWTLVKLLSRTGRPRAEPSARSRILHIFKEFDGVESLRLRPLSAHDASTIDDLFHFKCVRDICAQLAYRNALTLVAGASSCGWRSTWHDPDGRYLPQDTPGTLRWPELCVTRHRPAASGFFLAFLGDVGLQEWTQVGSRFRAPTDSSLPRAAVDALRDLALAVDIWESSQPTNVDEHEKPLLTMAALPQIYDALGTPPYDAPSSPTLGSAEEGKAASTEKHDALWNGACSLATS